MSAGGRARTSRLAHRWGMAVCDDPGASGPCSELQDLHSPKLTWKSIWGFPKIRGTFSRGHYNKDPSILGSILGSPYSGKLPYNMEIHMSYSLNSLRGGYIGDYIGDYCRGY